MWWKCISVDTITLRNIWGCVSIEISPRKRMVKSWHFMLSCVWMRAMVTCWTPGMTPRYDSLPRQKITKVYNKLSDENIVWPHANLHNLRSSFNLQILDKLYFVDVMHVRKAVGCRYFSRPRSLDIKSNLSNILII